MGPFSPADPRSVADADLAFADLFADERDGMVRLGTLLVGSVAIAEEIVQEAFMAVRARWDDIDRPGAYLRTTVVNGCSEVLRRRTLENRVQIDRVESVEAILPTQLIELRDALERLSDRQRVVMVLRYFVDLSDREIARTMEIRPSTVRSLRRRALVILRKELS